MTTRLEPYRQQIEALCRKYKVKRLALFGSASREDFVPGKSDYDFIVEFYPLSFDEYTDVFFGLQFALEESLRAPVDLIEWRALRNPYMIREVERTQSTVYVA